MSWLKKLLGGRTEQPAESADAPEAAAPQTAPAPAPKQATSPLAGLEGIRFGRYSDNNKTYAKTAAWHRAEERFKEGGYAESHAALFEYMRDDAEDNVRYTAGDPATFEIFQGSRRAAGEIASGRITARVPLARMEKPSTAAMRRLLELNYGLYYTRAALDDAGTLHLLFDSDVASANPTKLYYGLRELATKADRQDDLLLHDFGGSLVTPDAGYTQALPEPEVAVKWAWFRKWITEGLAQVDALNQDSFSGAIAYILLGILYRIDFLIVPEAQLLAELERINGLYWEKKDEIALVERNQMMKDALRKLGGWSEEQFRASVYRAKGTFAIATPPKPDAVKDTIASAVRDSRWYVDNKQTDIATDLVEYGVLHSHFIYSMPRPLTELTTVLLAVIHADYFTELGARKKLYDASTGTFDRDGIVQAVDAAIARAKEKYTGIYWEHSRVSYNSLHEFVSTFADTMAGLKLEARR